MRIGLKKLGSLLSLGAKPTTCRRAVSFVLFRANRRAIVVFIVGGPSAMVLCVRCFVGWFFIFHLNHSNLESIVPELKDN